MLLVVLMHRLRVMWHELRDWLGRLSPKWP